MAFPAAAVIGFFIHESIGISQVALFIVVAMVYVTLARGRLLGSSVMLHETQYPRVFAIAKRACAALEIPMPLVFAREDNLVPVVALGFGEPYALIISSHWIEVFRDDELAFMIGRELGHIAAGHTRYLSLLSVNGNENAFISAIFGAWLRRCTFTCDKVGLLCCGSLDAAIRAIGVASFHEFGRRIDYAAFAEQHREIENDAVMRWGAWLGSEPYATNRIASLRHFITSQSYEAAETWFLREGTDEPPMLPTPGASTVEPQDCAGWWRRFWAFSIDCVVVLAIIGSLQGVGSWFNDDSTVHRRGAAPASSASPAGAKHSGAAHATSAPARKGIVIDLPGGGKINVPTKKREDDTDAGSASNSGSDDDSDNASNSGNDDDAIDVDAATNPGTGPYSHIYNNAEKIRQIVELSFSPLLLTAYLAILVAVVGQTFGMMIMGLRVVTSDFRRAGLFRSLFRYLLALILWPVIAIISPFAHRVYLHDKWTSTRLITVERLMARVLSANR
jgi:RDD family/Peptidase family M48